MKKSDNIITINTRIWTIPSYYALEIKESNQVITNWIKRGNIEFRIIPELGNLLLVKRGSEKVRKQHSRKSK